MLLRNQSGINGGAIYNFGANASSKSSPTLMNCTFAENKAKTGSALHNLGINGESNPIIRNTQSEGN